MHIHDDNHKLTYISGTVTVKEICANKYASSAYTNLFNGFDNSHLDSRFGRVVVTDQAWTASTSSCTLFVETV